MLETIFIVGLYLELEFRHALAVLMMEIKTFSISGVGYDSRSSSRSLIGNVVSDGQSVRLVMDSPGCFPLITSNINTPKL